MTANEKLAAIAALLIDRKWVPSDWIQNILNDAEPYRLTRQE